MRGGRTLPVQLPKPQRGRVCCARTRLAVLDAVQAAGDPTTGAAARAAAAAAVVACVCFFFSSCCSHAASFLCGENE